MIVCVYLYKITWKYIYLILYVYNTIIVFTSKLIFNELRHIMLCCTYIIRNHIHGFTNKRSCPEIKHNSWEWYRVPKLMPLRYNDFLDSKVYGTDMGPTWVLSVPDGPILAPWILLSGFTRIMPTLCVILHQAPEVMFWVIFISMVPILRRGGVVFILINDIVLSYYYFIS